ncbi:tetratricopeptide repeat protein [Bacillus sp. ISL-39]|uniref:tetratricopeptide repeat protein n=1 Tax=Bacillus sp. ISL-39 TaxID=2819124 RepID=UPI001BE83A5C|nr:tetratricopeptide repeat protein [Bacillus sp. ISL-39]MBT2636632.1 tetratricopeptide repeat protein [Bacillus sp. ISL-39]
MDKYEESNLLYEQGLEHFRAGSFQLSLDCFLKSNQLDEHSRTYARIYECLTMLGKTIEAKPYIKIAYEMNPNHDKVIMQYVDTLLQEDKVEVAKELLNKLLLRNKTYNPARRLLEKIKSDTDS